MLRIFFRLFFSFLLFQLLVDQIWSQELTIFLKDEESSKFYMEKGKNKKTPRQKEVSDGRRDELRGGKPSSIKL